MEVVQLFYALPSPNEAKTQSLCREYALPRDEQENSAKRVDQERRTVRPCLGHKVCKAHGRYSVEVKVPSLFED